MKNGIQLNYCLLYCEESFIMNNLDYAICTKNKESQYCFKNGKKNVISGGIGGNWGKVDLGKDGCGFFCMGNEKYDMRKKEDIENKVSKLLNESNYEENIGEKNYSYDICKYKYRDKLEKDEDINKSIAQSEKNKNTTYKNIKNNPENKDCCIF